MEKNTGAQGAPQEAKGQTEDESKKFGMTDSEHETLKKALSQKAKLKEEKEKLAAEVELYKQQSLESEAKKDEALKYWKEKATELETKYKETTRNYGWNQVKSQLTNELTKAGCVEAEVALSLLKKEELSSIEIDENFNVSQSDISRIVDGLKKDQRATKIRLFASPSVNDMPPASGVKYEAGKEDLSKLSKDELLNKLKE